MRKRALILGNNNYEAGNILRCCEDDAKDVGENLHQVGFEVTVDYNLTFKQMLIIINKFTDDIEENDLVVFFFSGHGVQWNEHNYLIGIDNQCLVDHPQMYEKHSISAQETLNSMMEQKPFAVIFLLDCCRLPVNINRRSKAMTPKDESRNFAPMKGVVGSLIAFACGPNEETLDNSPDKRHSLFTCHLLKYIAAPNMKVEEMMARVCEGVHKDSGGRMYTYRLSCLCTTEVYFNFVEQGEICV